MALFPKSKGLGVMIAVGKPKGGPPMPPKGMEGAPKAPDMADDSDDSDQGDDYDIHACLKRIEACVYKIADAVGAEHGDDQTDDSSSDDQSDDSYNA